MENSYKFITERLKKLDSVARLNSVIEKGKGTVGITGVSHIHRMLLTFCAIAETGKRPLLVVSSEGEVERAAEDMTAFGLNVLRLPPRDFIYKSNISHSHEYEYQRIGTLSALAEGAFDVCVASAEAVLSLTVPKRVLRKRTFTLKEGDCIDLPQLTERLISGGYSRSEQVDGAGQFSVRGSILDIFTPNRENPVRIDFFGDEIDTIAVFEADTQRRTDTVKSIDITAVSESIPESTEELISSLERLISLKKTSELQKKTISEDLEKLRHGINIPYDRYLSLLYKEKETVLDYLPEGSPVFLLDTNAVYERISGVLSLHAEELKTLLEEGLLPPNTCSAYIDAPTFNRSISSRTAVFCDSFSKSSYPLQINELINLNFRQNSGYSGTVEALKEDITSQSYGLTVVMAGTPKAASNICEELRDVGIPAHFAAEATRIGDCGVFVTTGAFTSGFEIPEADISLMIYGHAELQKTKRRTKKGNSVGSLEELQKGDYVVHATHGIGIFDGVHQIKNHGITRDYIKILYFGRDVLYVPVTSLDLVSKYVGSAEDSNVKLNRLGSPEWNKTRARVKKAVKDMAKELTVLYAKRMNTKGYAFSPDGDLQSNFESRFEYDETEDQLRCASEIKKDMERGIPMDRLLCGDVGFGKTEVAFRAAFKCIADGKQCAVLVPTTILAWQHYNTALERFSNMAVNIEMISRFRTPKQQRQIKKDLAAGNIDLIIGTHSLISKDVKFRDLGLIITDEEQRFGVAQKEKLKQFFPGVDALTLSATPIPRTLNMALSGLRDMSSIEEAPQNRRPVQTYVTEQNTALINEAITRELRRGGQVYYLHNFTDTIESCASRIKQNHPDAAVAVAHGKMSEDELSEVWKRLTDREIDILVCTTIIETGVDVPNANTLIIENSDRMGLAQLHQLRGRVGRSHRTAYAYLMYQPGKSLTEISQKRLDAIRRFTEFGSGFRIAMRDLEIRGAGSILGGEQHGHMEAVGYDMYLKLLNDALREERGEEAVTEAECLVDIRLSAHIPESYISSLPQRLSAYRRIAAIKTEEDVLDVTDELLDRYGDLPKAVDTLIKVALYKNEAAKKGISEISEQNGRLLLYSDGLNEFFVSLISSKIKQRLKFTAGTRPYLSVKPDGSQTVLDTLNEVLFAVEGEKER